MPNMQDENTRFFVFFTFWEALIFSFFSEIQFLHSLNSISKQEKNMIR